MDEKQTNPELSQAELPPSREEQISTTTPTRKRQLDSDDDAEPRTKRARTTRPTSEPARLTRKNLATFNKMGKKKTSDPTDGSSTTTKTTSTTTSGFAIQARENGILDPIGSRPPEDLEDIRKRHARSRTYLREPYTRALNQAFTAFPKDVGFNNGLSAPQPDFVEGLEMEEYRPLPVDKHINGAVLYKDNPSLVHTRTQALTYIGKSDPLGHASATTFTTDGTNLNLYAYYAAPAEDDEDTLEYHQYLISLTNLTSSYKDFKKGRKQLRNAQDHAKEGPQNRTKLPPVAKGVHPLDVELTTTARN
ncbi:hypothetical protein B0T16DRAFT_433431 [Cercophora newfieldiana]|uniref:Uncharacterized protein n=1 Tax=Cercophora newfieldiana TaxID=92897 RepID=A0AA39YPV5_9PEZI|nr:hypothetical protein B0T16DRAFT_433431 [Cercophora newfieldiana]